MLKNKKNNKASRKRAYEKTIESRRTYCLHVIDRIIQSKPSEMRRLVNCYERREQQWRENDEKQGFCFEEFQKQNFDLLATLQSIVDEMESSTADEQEEMKVCDKKKK